MRRSRRFCGCGGCSGDRHRGIKASSGEVRKGIYHRAAEGTEEREFLGYGAILFL